jgi:hypothetical protein
MKKAERLIYLWVIASLVLIINSNFLYSQSPYYTINFSVSDEGTINNNADYKIEITTCRFNYDPVIPSGDYWFGKDTSLLNWDNLPDSMIQKLTCSTAETKGSNYEYSNQAMVWENIYAVKIIRNLSDTMFIVFPVKIKSFVTFIKLGVIPFKRGLYDLTETITYTFKEWLYLELPENYKWLPGEKNKGIMNSINLNKQK